MHTTSYKAYFKNTAIFALNDLEKESWLGLVIDFDVERSDLLGCPTYSLVHEYIERMFLLHFFSCTTGTCWLFACTRWFYKTCKSAGRSWPNFKSLRLSRLDITPEGKCLCPQLPETLGAVVEVDFFWTGCVCNMRPMETCLWSTWSHQGFIRCVGWFHPSAYNCLPTVDSCVFHLWVFPLQRI